MGTEEGWRLLLYLALSGVAADPGEGGSLAGGRGRLRGPGHTSQPPSARLLKGKELGGGRGLPPKANRKEAGKARHRWCWRAGRRLWERPDEEKRGLLGACGGGLPERALPGNRLRGGRVPGWEIPAGGRRGAPEAGEGKATCDGRKPSRPSGLAGKLRRWSPGP